MSFVLSKLIWPLATPSNLLALALALGGGLTLLWRGRRGQRIGRRLLGAALAILAAVFLAPVDAWLQRPLEQRFPAPDTLPSRVDGIVVLGGGAGESPVPVLGEVQLGPAADRLAALAILLRRYPAAGVVYSGGNASLRDGPREADLVRRLLLDMGIDASAVRFERDSRNTYENALLTRELADPQAGETWLLVTSAAHMPRAVGVFRRQGWSVLPLPVDFQADSDWRFIAPADSLGGRLGAIDQAMHEWVGLAAYRLLGYTDSWFPMPQP